MATPEITTALLTLAGAIVGALPGLITGFFNRRAEEKNHFRELVMKTTAENWRFIAENTKAVLPFEHYMIHASMMYNLIFSGQEITESAIKEHLERVGTVMNAMRQHANSVAPKRGAS